MRTLDRIVALLPCPHVCLAVWDERALWSYGALSADLSLLLILS